MIETFWTVLDVIGKIALFVVPVMLYEYISDKIRDEQEEIELEEENAEKSRAHSQISSS